MQPSELPAIPQASGIASSLREARAGQVLCIDAKGEVVGSSSRQMIASFAVLFVVFGGLASLGAIVADWLLGPSAATVAFMVVLIGCLEWGRRMGATARALELMGRGALGEAEACASAAASSRLMSRGSRGNARLVEGSAIWLQGDLPRALDVTRRAIAELGTPTKPYRAVSLLARFNEVQLLAVLGDRQGARERLEGIEAEGLPEGDLVRLQWIDTCLVLAFEEDDPSSLPEDLADWIDATLRTNRFGTTLVLLAWASERRDETDLVPQLLDVACDRLAECRIEDAHPRLARWWNDASARWLGAARSDG